MESLPPPTEKVERNREEGTGEEAPQEAIVDRTSPEHLLGSKRTPEDGSGKGSVDTGTREVILLTNRANIGDLGHLVVKDGRTDESRNEGGEHLAAEGDPRWNVGVMGEFEILGEVKGVRSGDKTVALEIEHPDGVPREPETAEQLSDHVEGDLYVGDSHDNTTWNAEDDGKEHTIQRSGGRGVGGVGGDSSGTQADGDAQDDEVGPLRDLSVRPHQAGVDVLGVGEG